MTKISKVLMFQRVTFKTDKLQYEYVQYVLQGLESNRKKTLVTF